MLIENLAGRMKTTLDDPMWANHIELHKNSLRAWLRVVDETIEGINMLSNKLADYSDAMDFIRPGKFKNNDEWVQHILVNKSAYARKCLADDLDTEIFR